MTTTAVSSLIEFLLALLGDEQLQNEFQNDPDDVLDRYGLDNTCGLDIRDAEPMVADHVGVSASGGSPRFAGSHDAATEISVITRHYVHDGPDVNNYNYYYVDDSDIIITVDDRDTVTIHADGDLTITDSFNEDNDITVIDDSFNQDNDGVDNKGGSIDDSTVTGDDIDSSLNSDDDTAVSDSGNTTVTETSTDASSDTTIDTSYNGNTADNDLVDVDAGVDSAGLWPTEDADTAVDLDAADAVAG